MSLYKPKKIDVGWYIDERQGKFVFFEPTTLFKSRSKPLSRRAVQACPAINELERDYFVIKNPFDIRLRCSKNGESYDLHVVEDGTRIDDDLISNFVFLMQPDFWRNKSVPVIQIKVPYFFLADEPCYMTMLAPYMSQSSVKWPGLMVGGRMPINIWPRILNFAFEWYDLEQDLILRRGQDLCYLYFETESLRNSVQLMEIENTKELQEYRSGIASTPKFMSNTFSLFETAISRRPKKLMVKKHNE
ncbi:hypothetical protein N9D19_00790 [Planktomarina temperata]|nr:hypothetical protein [Planktomarina temperata]